MSAWVSDHQLLNFMKELDHHNNDPLQPVSNAESSPKGWLQVKDGQISLVDSDSEATGDWPTAEAMPPLQLVLKGKEVKGAHRIKPNDIVGWKAEQQKLRIDVSSDKMKVHLLLLPDGKFVLKPAAQEKTSRLILQAVEDQCSPLELPSLQTILEEIRRLGLVNYDLGAIAAELSQPTFNPVVIASGKKPVYGKDASLQLFFSEQIQSTYEEIDGVIDYRNHLKIPSVRKGEMIARKIPLKESEQGIDVFGHPVAAPRPKDIIILPRKGVRVAQNEVFALNDGRPRITGDVIKMIDISTTHILTGDVDLKTGNIVFSGDVHIYGNVTDGMIVEALGDVYVSGNVYRATISATGSIYIKGNTVGSQLYSGHFGVLFNRLYTHSTKLNEQLALLRQVAEQLTHMADDRGQSVTDRQLYQLLLESKFRDIPPLCHASLACIANIQSIENHLMSSLKSKLQMMLNKAFLVETDIKAFLHNLQSELVTTIENIRLSEESGVVTDIQQCHLTEIMSNGNIFVRKQGVLQSKLYSKENIIFYQDDAVCRGSELEAGNTISVMIVGGVSGGCTSLKAGKKVMAALIYEGKVQVGPFAQEVLAPIEQACFEIKENRLSVDSINLSVG
ncbi:hypothetical protein SD71_01245 [Cohnella kolymensis]|uniref:Flagellar Assembly Protein A N-terminal region domain-containing protein n=1 Tax=Cohnella kolymensis TaxID=1590652 RepID=A0ABR5A9H8_9BACL|nr:FapA family protein [Cohnella kolymensis]KIL37338.1 hypothetical protein SD71_01245 [Cohnella kolymensis]